MTNRLVQSLSGITWLGIDVVILQGNHDYLRAGHSYFQFLDNIPRIKFIATMQELEQDGGPLVYCLPHTKTPSKDWEGFDFSHYDYLFMHQTVSGSIASNGQKMDGEPLPPLNAVKVYSGDIHVPQVIGGVEYVGSPYHVHFGDKFTPRCILIDKRGRSHDLHFESISRVALKVGGLRQLRSIDWLRPGDHVKLTVELDEAEKHEWRRIKREASEYLDKQKVEVFGIQLQVKASTARLAEAGKQISRAVRMSDPDAILRFVEHEDLNGEAYEMGLEILR